MKHKFLLAFFVASILTGCSTAYQSTKTPDDVYYSPAIGADERKDVASKEQKRYEQDVSTIDDQFLWMKVQNRYLWGTIDDYSYWYDMRYPYANLYGGYYFPINTYWNYWGGYYGKPIIVATYKTPSINTTAGSNISAYKNRNYSNSNINYTAKGIANGNSTTTSFGQLLRKTFTPANNGSSYSNNNSYSNAVRTYTPTTTSSSSSSTSSSAGGHSGGYSSSGSSSSGGRGGRGN